jgi:hypothetical protein
MVRNRVLDSSMPAMKVRYREERPALPGQEQSASGARRMCRIGRSEKRLSTSYHRAVDDFRGNLLELAVRFVIYNTMPRMFRRFTKMLYGSTPVEFESVLPLEESVKRLAEVSRRFAFLTLFREAAVGEVSVNRVSLSRHRPTFSNAFKPCFLGRFSNQQGRVVLSGRFTMMLFVKIFMTCWFGFCIFWACGATLAVLRSPLSPTLLPLGGLLMLGLGIGFVSFSKRLSANDDEYLSSVIRSALSSEVDDKPQSGRV